MRLKSVGIFGRLCLTISGLVGGLVVTVCVALVCPPLAVAVMLCIPLFMVLPWFARLRKYRCEVCGSRQSVEMSRARQKAGMSVCCGKCRTYYLIRGAQITRLGVKGKGEYL